MGDLRTELDNIKNFKDMNTFVCSIKAEIGIFGGRKFIKEKTKGKEEGKVTLKAIIKKMETLTDDVLKKNHLNDQTSKEKSFLGKKIELPSDEVGSFENALSNINKIDNEATDILRKGKSLKGIAARIFTSIRQAFGNLGFNREKHIDRLEQHSPYTKTVLRIIKREIDNQDLSKNNFIPDELNVFLKEVKNYLNADDSEYYRSTPSGNSPLDKLGDHLYALYINSDEYRLLLKSCNDSTRDYLSKNINPDKNTTEIFEKIVKIKNRLKEIYCPKNENNGKYHRIEVLIDAIKYKGSFFKLPSERLSKAPIIAIPIEELED